MSIQASRQATSSILQIASNFHRKSKCLSLSFHTPQYLFWFASGVLFSSKGPEMLHQLNEPQPHRTLDIPGHVVLDFCTCSPGLHPFLDPPTPHCSPDSPLTELDESSLNAGKQCAQSGQPPSFSPLASTSSSAKTTHLYDSGVFLLPILGCLSGWHAVQHMLEPRRLHHPCLYGLSLSGLCHLFGPDAG